MEAATRQAVGAMLGRIPSGIWIMTACDDDGRETGMLASWVQQAAFHPPTITASVHRERFLNEWLTTTKRVSLSLLGKSHKDIVQHFGKGFKPDEKAFKGIKTVRGRNGLPILKEALGWVEGVVRNSMTAGDHTVYLLEIESAGLSAHEEDEKPMVHLRKNGFHY
ncbi:MAG TPA: flavin reductase family protein [Planctomycetaceae bacterium]|nr:flavin reductase family protein [Planctomycetaceae bacterium]